MVNLRNRIRPRKTAAVVAAGSALALISGLLVPETQANAATMPTIQASAERLYTGTGHGTDSRCYLTSDNGYSPADDTTEDDFVCTADSVGYDIQYNIKTDDNPGDFTIVYKLDGLDWRDPKRRYANGNATVSNMRDMCASQAGMYKAAETTVEIGGLHYPACRISEVSPNLNASMKLTMTWSSGGADRTYDSLNLLFLEGGPRVVENPPQALASAPGFTAIGRMQVDPQLSTEASYASARVDGIDYVTLPIRAYAHRLPFTGEPANTYTQKGSLELAPGQYIELDTTGFPPGSRLFLNDAEITDGRMLLGSNAAYNGSPRGQDSIAAQIRLYVPQDSLPPITEGKSFEWPLRIKQTTPALQSIGGQENFNGEQVQPGQESASCEADSTKTRPQAGYRGRAGFANNDCAVVRLSFKIPPGGRVKKNVSMQGAYRYKENGTTQHYPKIKIGDRQAFIAYLEVNSLPTTTAVAVCDSWDPREQSIDPMRPIGVHASASAPLVPDIKDFTIEYLPGSEYTPGSPEACGVLGNSEGWFRELADVPGGHENVRAVRITSPSVRLNDGLRFTVPFVSKTTAEYDALLAERGQSRDSTGVTPKLEDQMYTSIANSPWQWRVADFFQQAASLQPRVQTMPAFKDYYVVQGGPTTINISHVVEPLGYSDPLTPVSVNWLSSCISEVALKSVQPSGDEDGWDVVIIPPEKTPTDCKTQAGAEYQHRIEIKRKKPVPGGMPSNTKIHADFAFDVKVDEFAIIAQELRVGSVMRFLEYPSMRSSMAASAVVTGAAALRAMKAVDSTAAEPSTDVTYKVAWSNGIKSTIRNARWIDVLPYSGDANGTRLSGPVRLVSVSPGDGVAVEYTMAAPQSIHTDPDHVSNLVGGATRWCTEIGAGVGCPATREEVTAIRFTHAAVPSGSLTINRITIDTSRSRDGDVIANRVGIGRTPDLVNEVPSPDVVRTKISTGDISGRVWHDIDRDAMNTINEDGSYAEPSFASVPVQLLRGGRVVAETTTDEEGDYRFTGVIRKPFAVNESGKPGASVEPYARDTSTTSVSEMLDGEYEVRVLRSGTGSTIPAPAYNTYSFDGQEMADARDVSTGIGPAGDGLAFGSVPRVDFGYYLSEPGISIIKKIKGEEAREGNGVILDADEAAELTFLVTNTGNEPLTDVEVTDDTIDASEISCPQTELGVGESMTCTATLTAIGPNTTHKNTATAEGTGLPKPNGEPGTRVTDSDEANAYSRANPSLTVQKWVNETDEETSPGALAPIGEDLAVRYVVTNTGDVPLEGVTLTDDNVAGQFITCPQTRLAVGEPMECTAVVAPLAPGVIHQNTVTATANPPRLVDGSEVPVEPSTDTVFVYTPVNPSISVTKTVAGTDVDTSPGAKVDTGRDLEVVFHVTNTGDVSLTGISLSDTVIDATEITCPATELPVGGEMDCTATLPALAPVTIHTNTVTVTANPIVDPSGKQTEVPPGTDIVYVHTGSDPRIAIVKYINGDDANEAPGVQLQIGKDAAVTFVVTNTGDVPLTNVSISDDVFGEIECPFDSLEVGGSKECAITLKGLNAESTHTNTATVTANGPELPDGSTNNPEPATDVAHAWTGKSEDPVLPPPSGPLPPSPSQLTPGSPTVTEGVSTPNTLPSSNTTWAAGGDGDSQSGPLSSTGSSGPWNVLIAALAAAIAGIAVARYGQRRRAEIGANE